MIKTTTMIDVDFWEWMNKRYVEWRGDGRGTISEFAEYVGVSQSVMSSWMKQNGKIPGASSLAKIASKLGLEVYDVLKLPQPNLLAILTQSFPHMTTDVRERLAAAMSEINDRSEGIPEGDPRLDEIIRDALRQNGFKL